MQSKYVEVAERARQAKMQGKPLKPLAQSSAVMLSVHSGAPTRPGGRKQNQKLKGGSKDKGIPEAVLKNLAAMLGAKVRQQPQHASLDSMLECRPYVGAYSAHALCSCQVLSTQCCQG
jgi:hypothetical protein